MDEAKKPLMIGIIVVCFVLAGGIYWLTSRGGGGGGIGDIPADEMQWMVCRNTACGASYQVSKRDYAKHMQENYKPITSENPPMVCRECGKASVFKAVKCAECGKVFLYGSGRESPEHFADRCPDCGFSATEDKRRQRRNAGQ